MLEKCGSIVSKLVDLMVEEYTKRPGNAYMFLSFRTAGIFGPDFFLHTHEKIFVAIGAEHIRFHDLRHTFAVNSLKAGDDIKTVQENLGHATASFTLSTYAHATPGMKRESANRMGQYLRRIRESTEAAKSNV